MLGRSCLRGSERGSERPGTSSARQAQRGACSTSRQSSLPEAPRAGRAATGLGLAELPGRSGEDLPNSHRDGLAATRWALRPSGGVRGAVADAAVADAAVRVAAAGRRMCRRKRVHAAPLRRIGGGRGGVGAGGQGGVEGALGELA